jgi:PPOX class probable F420-dependent enzyme
MLDGSPQMTEVWVDTDGEHVVVNTFRGSLKERNVTRDPRVAVSVADPTDVRRYFSVRGEVVAVTEDGAREHIDELSRRYLGMDYPGFGGAPQVRVKLVIAPHRIHGVGG